MTTHRVVILGAGAAGTAAARYLSEFETVEATLVGASGESPYNRTLVNKGVALRLIEPAQAALPASDAPALADTATRIDVAVRQVHLASGRTVDFDALLVATGSAPRRLRASLPGVGRAVQTGRLSTLHSMQDAVRVREVLTHSPSPARVILLGGGLVAAETASLLHRAGHDIVLVARSTTPGRTAWGELIAKHVAELHHAHIRTRLGRLPVAVAGADNYIGLTLDDGTCLEADLVVAALGTTPAAPEPWSNGVDVNTRLQVNGAPGVYGAGGVATHYESPLKPWRIDHWADSADQGTHAARSLLHGLGLGADPGPYRPRSSFSAQLYGRVLAGIGLTGDGAGELLLSSDPLLVVHGTGEKTAGAIGLDAGRLVREWEPHLHAGP